MEIEDFEKLGLNKNEAIVYLGLLKLNKSSASELVKSLGIHRNIIYDNLEKLIEKGLVSYIFEENKKIFISEDSKSILEFLNSQKDKINSKVEFANKLIPELDKLKNNNQIEQSAQTYRGKNGIKKVLNQILNSKENLTLGMTNKSTEILGELYWRNYNAKVKDLNIKEKIILNSEFEKREFFFKNNSNIKYKILPEEFNQITETIIFDNQVAIFIYSEQPIVFLIKDKEFYETSKKQFNFFWKICKNN
jgi:sugar-specific transcriptional regulator TrmB